MTIRPRCKVARPAPTNSTISAAQNNIVAGLSMIALLVAFAVAERMLFDDEER